MIREVRRSDFKSMVETFNSFFPEAEADPSFGLLLYNKRPTMKEERKWFEGVMKRIRKGDTVMAVAEADGRAIGWCEVSRELPKTAINHRATLGICVKKEYRGMGIGKALVAKALEESKGKFEIVELTVFSHNRRAVRLYEGSGFKKYGVRRKAVKRAGKYFDEDLMMIEL